MTSIVPTWLDLETRVVLRRFEIASAIAVALLLALAISLWLMALIGPSTATVLVTLAVGMGTLGADYRARAALPARIHLDERGMQVAHMRGPIRDVQWSEVQNVQRLPSGSIRVVLRNRERIVLRTAPDNSTQLESALRTHGVK